LDPVELARTLSEGLKPVLPLLVTAGNTMSEMVTGRALTAVEQWAIKVWRRLRQGSTPESTAVQVAARDVVQRPDDLDAAAALRLQLRKLLEADPRLAEELAGLVEEGRRAGVLTVATGARSVAVGGDMSDSVIVTGDDSTVRRTTR
jgi:predicted Rdx family selenoprotein